MSDSVGRPSVVNLVATPALGLAEVVRRGEPPRGRLARGGVFTDAGTGVRSVAGDPRWLAIESTPEIPSPWVAPGGGGGGLRLGLLPGDSYTAAVTFRLPTRLAGGPHEKRLRLLVWATVGGRARILAASPRPANERGTSRVGVGFAVPHDATAAWLQIRGGTVAGDVVEVTDLAVTATTTPMPHFDGDTPADRWYTYAWRGEPQRSASVRTMRAPSESFPFPEGSAANDVADEVVRRLSSFRHDEAAVLIGHLHDLGATSAAHEVCVLLAEEARALESLLVEDPSLRPARARDVRAAYTDRIERVVDAVSSADSTSAWVRTVMGERLVGLRLPRPVAERAARHLRIATVGGEGASLRAHYLLGRALENLDPSESAAVVRRAAARDRETAFDARAAAAASSERFAGRREYARFVAERLDTLRERAACADDLADETLGGAPVFMYWGQGFEVAPPLVRACRDALLRHHGPESVHLLDDSVLHAYSEIPDRIVAGTADSPAHFAGALRLDLLARYGGYWVDATCYLTGPLMERVPLTSDIVGIERFPGRFCSWFLGARRTSHLLRLLRAAVWLWWEERDDLADYFLLPGLFEALYRLDERCQVEWDTGRTLDEDAAHRLQRTMLAPGGARGLSDLLAASPIHKLAFRYDATRVPIDSALARLLRGGVPGR